MGIFKRLWLDHINNLLGDVPIATVPFFILGHGRSGTSWIGGIFSQVREVLYYNEPSFPRNCKQEDLYKIFVSYLRPDQRDTHFEKCLDRACRGLRDGYSAKWSVGRIPVRLGNKAQVVIKEVASIMSAEWMYLRYNARFLVVFRHPCAVCHSEITRGIDPALTQKYALMTIDLMEPSMQRYKKVIKNAKGPYEIFASLWGLRNMMLSRFIGKYPEAAKCIRYEELASDPMGAFNHLFEQCGFPFTPRVRSFIRATTSRHSNHPYSIYKNPLVCLDGWRSMMRQEDVHAIRNIISEFEIDIYSDAKGVV